MYLRLDLVSSGVPQWSLLDHIQFIKYLNERMYVSMVYCLHFADDLNMVLEITSPEDVCLLQQDLDDLFARSVKSTTNEYPESYSCSRSNNTVLLLLVVTL